MANGGHASNMLTVREVAELLHVHPNTLRRWSNKGVIRAYHITERIHKREEIARIPRGLNTEADNTGKAAEVGWL